MEGTNEILQKTGEKLEATFDHVCRTTKNASEKVQSCFDARIGAMVYGIIKSVISGIGILVAIGGFIYVNLVTSLGYRLDWYHNEHYTFRLDDVITVLIINAIITFGLICLLLDFSFSVVLAEGASKKKTGHLRAYFIYGIVRTVMLLIWSMVLYIVIWDNTPGALVLLLTGIETVMLMIVYKARQQIKRYLKGYDKFNNEVIVAA